MISLVLNSVYTLMSFVCLLTTNFPFGWDGFKLYAFFANPINVLIFVNSLIALSIMVFYISVKISYGSLNADEIRNSFLVFFNKCNLNILMAYFIVGINDIFEMLSWLSVFLVSNIFLVYNLIFLSRIRTANVFLETNRTRKVLRVVFFIILTCLNVALLFIGKKIMIPSVGQDIYFILFYDYIKSLALSLQIIYFLVFYYSPLPIWSRRSTVERTDFIFYSDKILEILFIFCDLIYICFIQYMKGFGNFVFNILIIYKLFWGISKALSAIKSFTKFIAINKRLSQSFLDATEEEVSRAGRCVICCEPLKEGKKLDCGHIFHLRCILNWLKYKSLCPMCRRVISLRDNPARSRGFSIGNSVLNASFERRGSNSVFRLNTPRLGFLLPSINFEFHQIFSRQNPNLNQNNVRNLNQNNGRNNNEIDQAPSSVVPRLAGLREATAARGNTERQEQMVRNISEVIPQVPEETIRSQLRRMNYNVTRVVNSLLEGDN